MNYFLLISSFVMVYSHFIEINLPYKQILYINVKILTYSKIDGRLCLLNSR